MDSLSRYAAIALLSVGLVANPVQAQVIPDSTLPTAVSSLDNRNFAIDGGARSGSNLFYSFSQFSVPTTGLAAFNNALDVQNIFARVTGGSVSNIDGILSANGSANLFLLNPSGLQFGPNARLNLGGSFLGTTASRIQFADGVEFSAVNPAPLLTMSVPIGLQMGGNPTSITVQGNGSAPKIENTAPPNLASPAGLQVQPGRTLALLGGNVTLAGGEIGTWGGHIELGSVRDAATVEIVPTGSGFTFSYDALSKLGNIDLAQQALINLGSGSLQIHGQAVRFTEGSVAIARNLGPQTGGQLIIRATDRVEFSGTTADGTRRSGILSEAFSQGSGSDLVISTGQLMLRDGAVLGTRTFSDVSGGNIRINTRDAVVVQGFQQANPAAVSVIATASFAPGKAGNVILNTPQLSLQDGGTLSSVNFASGSGGELQVNTQTAEVVSSSPAFSTSGITSTNLGIGAAGTVTINTGRLRVASGGAVLTTSINDGRAGNITIRASESIVVAGDFAGLPSTISSSISPAPPVIQQLYGLPALPKGQAGEVNITTPQLSVTDGATLSVANLGLGNAGNLQVNADVLSLDRGGKIEAATLTGEGGNINIEAQELKLRHLSQITTTASGSGNGGNIAINSPIILGLENSDIIANAFQGSGGNIDITTQGIIGLEFRNTLTPRTDPTNDITASSQFSVNGTVQINHIGVNPSSSLVELPVDTIDPSQKIATGCTAQNDSSFVATGRGGVPENPMEVAEIDRPWSDLRSITQGTTAPRSAAASMPIEATTLVTNAQGQIALIGEGLSASNPQGVNCSRQ
jgi:filamentous hemagglutinin family protein